MCICVYMYVCMSMCMFVHVCVCVCACVFSVLVNYYKETIEIGFHYFIVNRAIGIMNKVFANGPGDLGSIPSRVILKTQKWYLILPCLILSIIRYGSRVK